MATDTHTLPAEYSQTPSRASTSQSSESPLKEAVRSIYRAMLADFGTQFAKLFEDSGVSSNAWQYRLYGRVKDIEPSALIDGYDEALKARMPHMPTLNDIAETANRLHRRRTRAEAEIEQAEAPRFKGGLLGYVDHVLSAHATGDTALHEIEAMRKVLTDTQPMTKEERLERLKGNVEAHQAMLAKLKLKSPTDSRPFCDVTSCSGPGVMSHSLNGLGPWYCKKHWRAST